MIFISLYQTIENIIVALAMGLGLTMISYKLLGILQSCGYSQAKLIAWSHKRNNMIYARLTLLCLLTGLSYAVFALCFYFVGKQWSALIGLLAYVAFFTLYIVADRKVALRSPAVKTPRLVRTIVVQFVVCTIVSYLLVTLCTFVAYIWDSALCYTLRYLPLCLLPVVLVYLVCLSGLICKIYEVPHNKSYVKKAKVKLQNANLQVVGVTGSCGKTSVKHILCHLLKSKYRVLATSRSYNTPMGIALVVNSNDLADHDVFIAEMGARHLGDIAHLCDVCPPDYALITGICPQHLESFLTIENIVKAKGEILQATKKGAFVANDCFAYFADNGLATECNCVKNVVEGCTGTDFTLCLGGKEQTVHTQLLGEHNAQNIGLASQLAYQMGVSFEDICQSITTLPYVEHRLQLVQTEGVFVLDDGYNANIKGVSSALNVLKKFEGNKIVVTPGMVELGILEEKENAELGKQLVGLDAVILVGETLITPVKEGYLSNGGDPDKLTIVPNLQVAKQIVAQKVQKGDCVLFLNDLPDLYL